MTSLGTSKLPFSRVYIIILVLFMAAMVLEGILRFIFIRAGLAPLVYAPKGLITLALLLSVLLAARAAHINKAFIIVIGLALWTLALGVLQVRAIVPVLFGVWAILPFFFGVAIYPYLRVHWRNLRPIVFILWGLAVLGIILNNFVEFPWAGFEFQLAGVNLVGSRAWATFDVSRLAGFSRVSIAAASHITLLALWLLAAGVRRWLALIIIISSAVALYLTTMKTITGAFILLSLFVLLRPYIARPVWVGLPTLAALIGFVLPFSTLITTYNLTFENPVNRFLFASFGIRLAEVWPQTLELVQLRGQPLLGRGIGGIGGAQQYFEPSRYTPGDNLMLYLYVLGGVLFVVLLFIYALAAVKLEPTRQRFDAYMYTVMMTVLLQGITGNVMESAFFSLFFGVSLRHVMTLPLRQPHQESSDVLVIPSQPQPQLGSV